MYTVDSARNLGALYHPRVAYNIWRVKLVPRLPVNIRINLKRRNGPTHRIGLVRQPAGRRYWVCRDGKYSTKVPEATATQIAERIRRWLVADT